MTSAKALREKFEDELKALQEICPHDKTTDCHGSFGPGHFTGVIHVICDNCEKELETRQGYPDFKQHIVSNGPSEEDE